jgi:energy-coupling factor transport system substrate-specific component
MKKRIAYCLSSLNDGLWRISVAVAACSLLNLLFSWINNELMKSPLFLDSIFTAVGAALLGPYGGMAIGLLTNFGMELVYGMSGLYWPFAICNMATGLIVGLMVRRGVFKQGWQVTVAVLLVTFANALLGSLVANIVFSGNSGVQIDHIISAFVETGQSLAAASFWARIPTNLIDKMLAVYAAYGLLLFIKKESLDGFSGGAS